MCICYTTAKIRKAFKVKTEPKADEKLSFVISAPRLFLRKISPDGNAKKKQGIIPDFVLRISCPDRPCHCYALALVNTDPAVCVYVFCIGIGYCITAD
jgi:hypothetical protein